LAGKLWEKQINPSSGICVKKESEFLLKTTRLYGTKKKNDPSRNLAFQRGAEEDPQKKRQQNEMNQQKGRNREAFPWFSQVEKRRRTLTRVGQQRERNDIRKGDYSAMGIFPKGPHGGTGKGNVNP